MELSFLLAIDVVGTIAFAISGAMLAIKKEMDIFGVNILAIMTAAGGGVLRDVLIGEIPPKFFQNPVYTLLMVISASLVFFLVYFGKMGGQLFSKVFEKVLFLSDTLGLAAFTVDGVSVGMHTEYGDNLFLVISLGVLTGVGGGIIRDVLATEKPYVFVRHIYACASILGALITAYLWHVTGENYAVAIGFVTVIVIRVLAATFRWNLPRIHQNTP